MAVVDNKDLPLLSFLATLFTEPTVAKEFRANPEAVMDRYALTWDQKVAIYHGGADPLFLGNQNVPGLPPIDTSGLSAAPGGSAAVPLTAGWWAAYALFKAQKEAGTGPTPTAPPSPQVNERPRGDRASLAGLMILLGEELARSPAWGGPW